MKLPRPQLDGIVKRIFRTPPSEAVAIAKALEPEERAAARERKAHDGRPGKLPERRTGDTPDKVAAHTIQNRCAGIKLLAEGRAGELLAETGPKAGKPRLKDLGLTETQSHRWQAVAAVPA